MKLHFILSHPAVPENIGFALRALKVMGFSSMRLVNPPLDFFESAKKTAYGSHDLLASAQVYASLQGAVVDMDLIVGTTAKHRQSRHDYHEPAALRDILKSKASAVQHVAIVFGSEQSGLSSDEIMCCDLLSTIPMAVAYPSLNLAQSVLLYAYELNSFNENVEALPVAPQDTSDQIALKNNAIELLQLLDVPRQPSLYLRIKDRIMAASAADTQLMLALGKFLKQSLRPKN